MIEMMRLFRQKRKLCILMIIELTMALAFLNMVYTSAISYNSRFESIENRSEMPLYTIVDEFTNEHEFFKDPHALERIKEYHKDMATNENFSYMDIIMQPIEFADISIEDASFYYIENNSSRIKSVQVSSAFFDNFQIVTDQGRPFLPDDYIYTANSISAILGYNYHTLFKIGDTYRIAYLGMKFDMEIVGFLPQYSSYIHQGEMLALDDYILLPARNFLLEPIRGVPEFDHQVMLSMQKLGGTVLLNSHDELPDFIKTMNALLKKHGVFPLGILQIPNVSIQILSTLAGRYLYTYIFVAAVAFFVSLIGVMSLLNHIVQVCKRTLGILVLCGARQSTIATYLLWLVAYLFAIAHVGAFVISTFVMGGMEYHIELVLWSVLILVLFYFPYCIHVERRSLDELLRRADT
ncbi:ABC transporter permease [Bacillota bacterium Meth-B3]